MSYDEMPITGYLDRFSHRPGESFIAHIGLRTPGSFRVRLVKVVSGDPNPAGPGLRLDDLSGVLDRTMEGINQPIRLGSHAVIERMPARAPNAPATWTALVWPGVTAEAQTVMAEYGGGAVELSIGGGGASGRW